MKCIRCGSALENHFGYCPFCGADQRQKQENMYFSPGQSSGMANHNAAGYDGINQLSPPPMYIGQQSQYGGQPYAYGNPIYTPFNPMSYNARGVPQAVDLVDKVSRRTQSIAIVWLVIGLLQGIFALYNLFLSIEAYSGWYGNGTPYLITGLLIGFVSTINILGARGNFRFSKTIRFEPVGIVKRYEKISGYIIALVCNLLIGAIIGVIGNFMELILRNFVLKNTYQLQIIEEEHQKSHAGARRHR